MPSSNMSESGYHTEISWQERALHYGDGLFETLLKQQGEIALWQQHLERLHRGCLRLSIEAPDSGWLREEVFNKSRQYDSCIVKIIVSRGQGGRGLNLPNRPQPSVFVLCYPWHPPSQMEIKVSVCDTRLPINPNLAGIKHLNRLDYVLAALELQSRPDLSEGILCDYEGFLVEGIISNLFFVIDGQLMTPSLQLAGVDGIMRNQIIRHCENMNLKIRIDRFPLESIYQASEIFMSNSVRGICPVTAVDNQEFVTGPLTQKLARTLDCVSAAGSEVPC